MWQYFYAHVTYHGVRWFPQGNRWKMCMLLITFALLLPVPQLYVVTLERSSRVCVQPLLDMAIASIVLSFFTIAFSLLFCILIPVPRELKIGFHVFGVASLIVGLMQTAYTFEAKEDCSVSTPELYTLSLASSMFSVVSLVFLGLMFPFWVVNKVKRNLVMDPYSRTGVCYEPTKCCTCLWHI
ncbi:uncharacterized protein LOC132731641 [Ruditapes philippinarum]|uniref:uncharacterized protein LOC132731641 n=1 Tax=Ruditapes philippinarum TaxID=129788 RepID=UPI00295AF2D9|nr:uncharacterized protein LOC132731641 [Ruditapes philippinarum]